MATQDNTIYNWGYRIRTMRERKRLTQDALAEQSGLSPSYISKVEKGFYRKGPKEETLVKLARGLGISTTALRHQIYEQVSSPHKETPEEILERLRLVTPISIPVYMDFPFHAGEPMEPAEYVYVARPKGTPKNIEGYIVHGNCLEPDVIDGDIIIVDRDGQIDNGNIVACLLNNELHIARLRKIDNELWLENKDGRSKLEDCQVAAPVILIQRRLK